jgi:outer membrane murein-binding lipoprotein Lpp
MDETMTISDEIGRLKMDLAQTTKEVAAAKAEAADITVAIMAKVHELESLLGFVVK